ASLSIQPKFGKGAGLNLVVEYRDLLDSSGVPPLGLLALGAELYFKDTFFVRAGYGSGYPSLGVGFKRKSAEFSFAWESEECGTTYLSQRDARYQFQFGLKF